MNFDETVYDMRVPNPENAIGQAFTDLGADILRLREQAVTIDIIIGNSWSYDLYVVIPWDCEIVKIWSVLQGETATAAETITFKNNAGTSMTAGVITIAVDSAIGTIDECTPTGNNLFAAGDKLKITIGSENSNTVRCEVTILCNIG